MNRSALGLFLFLLATGILAGEPKSPPSIRSASQSILWMEQDHAYTESAKDGKLILIDVYADWCVPCKIMDRTTWVDSSVVTLVRKGFHAVKVDADSEAPLQCEGSTQPANICVSKAWKLQGLPSLLILDTKGRVLLRVTQFLDAPTMREILSDILGSKAALLQSVEP